MKKLILQFDLSKLKKSAFTLVELPVVRKRAFTLVELMVIIVIIGLISTIVLVNMGTAKYKAKDTKTEAEMSAFRDAIMTYKLDNAGYENACTQPSVTAIMGNGTGSDGKFINPDCRTDQTRWAFSAKLPSAGTAAFPAICMDSTGVTKVYTEAVGISASFTCTTNAEEIAEAQRIKAENDAKVEAERVAATPVFDPPAGQYFQGQSVNITSSRAGSTIYYTTNNTTPTTASTNQAVTPLVITRDMTVKAIAVKTGFPTSAMATANYTVLGIGSPYKGGKIAYFLKPGDIGYNSTYPSGFVASVADVGGAGRDWANQNCDYPILFTIGAYSWGIGDGFANTNTIVSKCGLNSAAGVAANYTASGNSNWYLPSYYELDKILNTSARSLIGNFDVSSGDTGYWTSTQSSDGIWFFWFQLYEYHPDPVNVFAPTHYGHPTGVSYRIRPISYFGYPDTDNR